MYQHDPLHGFAVYLVSMAAKAAKGKSGKTSKHGAFAFSLGKTTLGEGLPSVELRTVGARTIFSVKGADYATIEIVGDEVLVRLRPAAGDVDAMRRSGQFVESSGWFEIHLTRNAKDWLAAEIGARSGRALKALRDPATLPPSPT